MALLNGIRIVEFGEEVTTPFAGKLLADLGADVIKVEPLPYGDRGRVAPPFAGEQPGPGRSLLFAHLNAQKRSLALRLPSPAASALLSAFLREADALLCGYSPAALGALGLSLEALHSEHPRLVIAAATSFGMTGPYRDAPGSPFVSYQASGAGHTSPFYVPNLASPPLVLPCRPAAMTGGLMGAAACLLALLARRHGGEGAIVDVSEVETLFPVVADQTNNYNFSGTVEQRNKRVKGMAPFGFFPVKDRYASLFIIQEAQWQRFVHMMGDPEWTKAEMFQVRRTRAQYKEDLEALMAPWLEQQEAEALYARSQAADVPIGPARTMDNVMKDEQLIARRAFAPGKRADGGPFTGLRAPYLIDGESTSDGRRAPALGEHTRQLLMGWLGLSSRDVDALAAGGVL
jgi:crotonobetainyl-CoA:carnitine CoA-transferase CaiB-like acyl-CoA transferase